MLARSRKYQHPLGIDIKTPLLVPSFSSKGFGYEIDQSTGERKSNIGKIFDLATEYLTDVMLVSAYDLAQGHLKSIGNAITEITIIDSGGYETSDFHDYSSINNDPVRGNDSSEWTEEALIEVYENFPSHVPAIIVSFDRPDVRIPLSDQIETAKALFARFPDKMHTLLIKPESSDKNFIEIENIISHIEQFESFHIIGLTEKELAETVFERMNNIAALRIAMDKAGAEQPIHIYGSLDPLTSVLYFLSGAEIFDGLTWIRYGYNEGVACYYHNYSIKNFLVDRNDDFIKLKMMNDNLSFLWELRHTMEKFILDRDFDRFGLNGEVLKQSYDLLKARNDEVREIGE